MIIETLPFDAAQYLDTPQAHAELLNDAFETGGRRPISLPPSVSSRAPRA